MAITITLPDGTQQHFEQAVTAMAVATSISPGLAREALAARVNSELWDLTRNIETDADITIITRNNEEDALQLLRHDTAHVLAQAVKELFPETQVSIGPAIENGFYYDFYRDTSFIPDDLPVIEAKMQEIIQRNEEIIREVWDRKEAIAFFTEQKELFKAELIRDLPEDAVITLYRQGNFLDLCKGPHLPSTGRIGKAFKLTSIAGAYWRGDAKNAQMQRIYGTAWRTPKELKVYLKQLEEAEKRDHRRLGKQMHLFSFHEDAIGSIFWHPRGWKLYQNLERFIRKQMEQAGYDEVRTPQLLDRSLWETSGHWGKFQESMFTTEAENRIFALKPMNCPGAIKIFNEGIKSYRDLPVRYSELNTLHRFELSGALHGMMRLRSFNQDDAHIFCTEDQINAETKAFCDFTLKLYQSFGFENVRIKFSDRPEKRAGSDEVWDKAEAALKDAIQASGLEYSFNPGEGAFYGPKIEFVLRDAIGRDWQCGTLQVDFILPERFNTQYVAEDGEKYYPVMLHRAALGSLERFLGILIESTVGNLPQWLTPVPVVIATITHDCDDWAKEIQDTLRTAGINAELDLRNEKIGYKVRQHITERIPEIWVIGKREAENRQVAIRKLGSKNNLVTDFDTAFQTLKNATQLP